MTSSEDTPERPVAQGCPFHPENAPLQDDRAAGWAFFRAAGPVARDENGVFYLTSREAVLFAQQHPAIFSSRVYTQIAEFVTAGITPLPLAYDRPDHTMYRRILSPMFAPKVLSKMDGDLRQQAGDLIDGFLPGGQCEFMDAFAKPFPAQVFLTMFGMPLEDREMCTNWVRTLNGGELLVGGEDTEREKRVEEANRGLLQYITGFIDSKRAHPGDDLFSNILAFEGDEKWSDEELLGFGYMFAIAGLDTVTATLGFVFGHLATHPDERAQMLGDPSLLGPLIEEIIRLEPVAPIMPRVTTQDVEVCGTFIPAGSMVLISVGSANRDPSWHPNPDSVDPEHSELGHLTFGGGIHRCLGSHLARRELRIAVEEFHKRIPHYELAPGIDLKPAWPAATLSYESLPLRFAPASTVKAS